MGDHERFFWTLNGSGPVEDFIKKNRPSIITSDDTPWIWVQGTDREASDPERDSTKAGALAEAETILSKLLKRLEEIEADDAIPTRAKKGVKSKKVVRDEANDEAKEALKALSTKSKWTVGKWLFFPQHAMVDGIWSTVAKSVASGPLRDAGVFLAKVAPTPDQGEGDHITQVVCLYLEDVYDLELVRSVLEILLTQHGLEPSAVKSDLYTLAGIDSKHPTKLRSSIWRPHEVIEGGNDAIKELKEQYSKKKKSDPNNDKGEVKQPVRADGIIESDSEDERISRMNKRKTGPDDRNVESKTEEKKAPGKKPANAL